MKRNELKEALIELLKDGPILTKACVEALQQKFGDFHEKNRMLREIRNELNIQSIQASDNRWYLFNPEVKMSRRELQEWLNKHKPPEDKEDVTGEIEEEFDSLVENPYVTLEENSIYYFDTPDDFSQLTNYSEEWGKALRRKPQRIETFKQLAALDPDDLPEILDPDGEPDIALIWMIKEYNWIEEAKEILVNSKEQKYKEQIRDENRESVLHRKEFKNYYGYNAFPSTNYGIQPHDNFEDDNR